MSISIIKTGKKISYISSIYYLLIITNIAIFDKKCKLKIRSPKSLNLGGN